MKEYKYKINGNAYKVTIGDIEDDIAHVRSERYSLQSRNGKSSESCSQTGSTPCLVQPQLPRLLQL